MPDAFAYQNCLFSSVTRLQFVLLCDVLTSVALTKVDKDSVYTCKQCYSLYEYIVLTGFQSCLMWRHLWLPW